jgi:hypothetical protein
MKHLSKEVEYNTDTLSEHFNEVNKAEILSSIYSLGKEGKNVINTLNQIKIAKELGGDFVGDIEDNWDIEAKGLKLELKSQVNIALGTYAGQINMGQWQQKEGWDYIIHYLPKSFSNFLEEDKFVVFSWEDRDRMIEYSTADGKLTWTMSLYNHSGSFRRNGDKVKWMLNKIHNLESLRNFLKL